MTGNAGFFVNGVTVDSGSFKVNSDGTISFNAGGFNVTVGLRIGATQGSANQTQEEFDEAMRQYYQSLSYYPWEYGNNNNRPQPPVRLYGDAAVGGTPINYNNIKGIASRLLETTVGQYDQATKTYKALTINFVTPVVDRNGVTHIGFTQTILKIDGIEREIKVFAGIGISDNELGVDIRKLTDDNIAALAPRLIYGLVRDPNPINGKLDAKNSLVYEINPAARQVVGMDGRSGF